MRYLALLVLLLLLLPPLFAFTPDDAMQYRHPQLPAAHLRAVALREVCAALDVGVGGYASGNFTEEAKSLYTLNMRFLRDPLARMDARRSLEEAEAELRRLNRTGIRDALLAHSALLAAQSKSTAAQFRVQSLTLALIEAERKWRLGALGALDVELARLDLEDATLSRQQSDTTLRHAQAQAMRLGFLGEATGEIVSFNLPDVSLETAVAYRALHWDMKITERRAQAAARNIRPALGADISYISSDLQLSSMLSSRDRSANLLLGYPSLYDNTNVLFRGTGWQTTVKVDIPIDPTSWAQARAAKADHQLARVALTEQADVLILSLQQLLSEAETAHKALGLAQQRAELAARRHAIMQEKVQTGSVSEITGLEDEAAYADAQARVADSWGSYLQATAVYLDAMNGLWEVE